MVAAIVIGSAAVLGTGAAFVGGAYMFSTTLTQPSVIPTNGAESLQTVEIAAEVENTISLDIDIPDLLNEFDLISVHDDGFGI